jgi:hypothetical protein
VKDCGLIFYEARHTFGRFFTIQVTVLKSNQIASIKQTIVNMHDCQSNNMKAITSYLNDYVCEVLTEEEMQAFQFFQLSR